MANSPYSSFRSHKTLNKTFQMIYSSGLYRYNFDPAYTDPAGMSVYFIVPENTTSNLINPNTPRTNFLIKNEDPTINEYQSSIILSDTMIYFDKTQSGSSVNIYQTEQGAEIELNVRASDATYEDNVEDLEVYVTLIFASVVIGYIWPLITPDVLPVTKLSSVSSNHVGTFTIPTTVQFSTLAGLLDVPTVADADYPEQYTGVLLLTVVDTEGGSVDFVIYMAISELEEPFPMWLILAIVGVVLLGLIAVIVVVNRKKRG
jgi:hypothetical protein